MTTLTEPKAQKGYRLPLKVIEEVEILAARRRVRPCRLVEQALRDLLDRYSSVDHLHDVLSASSN